MIGIVTFLVLAFGAVAAADGLYALLGWLGTCRAERAEVLRQRYLDAVMAFHAYEKATRRRVALDACVCPPHELWVTPWTRPRALVRDAAALTHVLDHVEASAHPLSTSYAAALRLRSLLPTSIAETL